MATAKEKPQPEEGPRKLDEAAQPGGVYVVNNQVVDAEGKPLDGWAIDNNGNAVQVAGASNPPKSE